MALLRVRRAELGRDDALEQVCLVVGPAPERREVPGRDAVASQARAGGGNVPVPLGEALRAVDRARLDEPVLLQVVDERRVESSKLEDGDEVQIGKYKLTFLES